jgi:hypothetical protein
MHFCLFFRNQSFVYSGIRKRDLRSRILEVRHKSNIKHKRWVNLLYSVVNLWHFRMDPDPRIRSSDLRIRIRIILCSSVADKQPTKGKFFSKFFCLLHFEVHLHQSSKIKSQKKLQKSKIKVFSSFFCLLMEGSGSVQSNVGSGSGRSKTYGSGSTTMPLKWINFCWQSSNKGSKTNHALALLAKLSDCLTLLRTKKIAS